jgi:hypothetical protein
MTTSSIGRRFSIARGIFAGPKPVTQDDGHPDFFAIRNWQVFRPGYHKKRLYTKFDCQQIVANFQRLSVGPDAYLKARGKIGHDNNQSIRQSLGLPSAGRITACRLTPDGGFEIDLEGIPAVGIDPDGHKFDFRAAIEQGAYPDGSVELVWDVPDPDRPAETIPGPVLEGIAFLGEEQPGVSGLPSPQVSERFCNIRQVSSPEHREIHGRQCRLRRVRFSEVSTVNRDQLIQQLRTLIGDDAGNPEFASMTDDQLAAVVKMMGGDGSEGNSQLMSAMKMKYSAANGTTMDDGKNANANAEAPPKWFAQFAADCEKRFGAMEQSVQGLQGMKQEVQQAAKFGKEYEDIRRDQQRHSVEEVVREALRTGRIAKIDADLHMTDGLNQDRSQKFSADKGQDAGLTAFEVWRRNLMARPVSELFASQIDDGAADVVVGSGRINDKYIDTLHTRKVGGWEPWSPKKTA